MKKKLSFIWIDDEPEREEASINLAKQNGVKCKFIDVSQEDVNYISLIDEIKPDLILVDHNLTQIKTGDIKKGSTIAAFIRENHPKYPIACITGQEEATLDSQQRLSYEAVFSYSDIKMHYETMISIAEAYKKLNANPPQDSDQLIAMMKVPDAEVSKLKNILPHDIKENYNDSGVFANISSWIRNVLIERPGFLYDRIWVATILGLNESGFKKIEPIFKAAKYNGLFSDKSKERWWKSEVLKILSRKIGAPIASWEKGRLLLPKMEKKYLSVDHYTEKEEYPEVVAYLDETSDKRVQMKLKYTVPHPKYDKLLFFEEIRMMQAQAE